MKNGETPTDWKENKRRQKDIDARWTKKNGKTYYGYKNHIQADNDNKLIRDYDITDARVHDPTIFEALLDDSNTCKDIWADSAYLSEKMENTLKEMGYRSKVQRKGSRGKPLSKQLQKGNKTRYRVRSRVEHIFGALCDVRVKSIKSIGVADFEVNIGLMNLTYNMRRLCFLMRINP